MSEVLDVYLAGPGVFLPDPKAYGERKKEICARHGFRGVFPIDAELALAGLSKFSQGCTISLANEQLIRHAHLVIADMTPYHGVSMDVGTGYEMGFGRALQKPVFGYSNVVADFFARAQAKLGPITGHDSWGRPQIHGMALEDFDMIDNLMVHGAVAHNGVPVIAEDVPPGELYTSLAVFEKVVALAARTLLARAGGTAP